MIPAEVAKLRRFTTSCGIYLLSYAALTGVYFYLTLLYQDVDGWTALRTGLSWLFMNVPFLVTAQFAGRLSRRLSARAIVGGGCLVTAAGIITFSTLTPSSPFVIAAIGYALFGVGTGMWIPGVANVAMRDVPPGTVRHRVRGIQCIPPSRDLCRSRDPRRCRRRCSNVRMEEQGRSSPRHRPRSGDRASSQRCERPNRVSEQGTRGKPQSRCGTGLLSWL